MKFILTAANTKTPLVINDNWRDAAPHVKGGTVISWADDYVLHVAEPFEEFCEAVKASRRFAPDMRRPALNEAPPAV